MSWPAEEWKVGLPVQALRAITQVEQRMERLQKERQQKQVQLDTLEALMHKQKKKHEEERISWSLLSQQNRSLAEAREQAERAHQRLAQELQAKEVQLSCLKGQLVQANRHQAELQEELHRCQAELERLQSRSTLVLPSPGWGSLTPCAEGGGEIKTEPNRTLAAGTSQIQGSSHTLASSWENRSPLTQWQPETAFPAAPPGSPIPAENGEGILPVASEMVSAGERLKKDNEELRLTLAKAEKRKQEMERELWSLQKQLEVTRTEVAQWKKQRSGQAEGLLGMERMPPSGSCRSMSASRLEPPSVKRGAAIKLKGPSPRPQGTDWAQEELQDLRAEVLMLRRHLDTSESQCKSLLENCWQNQESRTWAQAKQVLSCEIPRKKGTPEFQSNGHSGVRVVGPSQGEALVSGTVEGNGGGAKAKAWSENKVNLEPLEVGEAEVKTVAVALEQAPGDMPALVEEKDRPTAPTLVRGEASCEGKIELEGNTEALREKIRALATGKAKAEAQASLARQKLQSLQATLGKQTERLAQAMETQSCHVEELLTDAEEKDGLIQRLSRELGETKKALDTAGAESQRLRVLLRELHRAKPADASDPHRGREVRDVPGEESQAQPREGHAKTGLAGHLQEEKQEQLDNSGSRVRQQCKEAWHWEKGDDNATGPPDLVCSGHSGQAEAVDVLHSVQKRELWLQGSQRDAQTQTEGPYCGVRHREYISVAFDDTHYEPYGLPEVVMKGFADIPSGPSCPYVLRRGILGSAPVAQLAPRAEPEEDSPETEEGAGV